MFARIFKPSKDASQSGLAGTKKWLFVFEPESPKDVSALTGWTSSEDTRQQVRLSFETQEEAVSFAKQHKIPYRVEKTHETKRRVVAYSDNFKFDRVGAWTH